MGNRMTVENPYIIDEILSDDDDDDDDYFNYETAYEAEPWDDDDDDFLNDRKATESCAHLIRGVSSDETTICDSNGIQEGSVVSSLVKEVETLLTYLDNDDLESARKSAHSLKDGGSSTDAVNGSYGEAGDSGEKNSDKDYSHSLSDNRKDSDLTLTQDSSLIFRDESTDLLCDAPPLPKDGGEEKQKGNLTYEERKLLRKLDRDLDSFEENESRVASDVESSAIDTDSLKSRHSLQPRRKRKSSLPRLKRDALTSSTASVAESGISGSSRSRENSLSRSPRKPSASPGCGRIPRPCYNYKVAPAAAASFNSTTTKRSSGSSGLPIPGGRMSPRGSPRGSARVTRVDEAVMNCVKSYTSQASSRPTENGRSGHEVKGQKVNKSEMWEVNLSDFTGRPRRNKKRSGIPSLWMQKSSADDSSVVPRSLSHQAESPAPSFDSESTSITTDSLSQFSSDNERLARTNTVTLPGSLDKRWNMSGKKVLDQKRWNCISRPQYKRSCGITSLVSCWNFLFSTMGSGQLPPVKQEEALNILGFEAPYDDIVFGPFTGNLTLIRWFHLLNNHFQVQGRGYFLYKPKGKKKTTRVTSEVALDRLKSGLRDPTMSFIYHCHNHYFCPIGFEESASHCEDAYNFNLCPENIGKTWIYIGDSSRKHSPIHCKSWDEICLDLNCENPDFYNIREPWKGIKQRVDSKKTGNNLHCILCFQSSNRHFLPNDLALTRPQAFILHPSLDGCENENDVMAKTTDEVDWSTDALLLDDSPEDELESVSNTDLTHGKGQDIQLSMTNLSIYSDTEALDLEQFGPPPPSPEEAMIEVEVEEDLF